MGIVSRWRTQRQLGEPQWNPSPAQAARPGERGAVNVPCGPPTATNPPPPTHTHTHRLESVEEVKKTSTHRCSSMQMYTSVHAYKHTLSLCHPPPPTWLTHTSVVRRGTGWRTSSVPLVYPPLFLLPPSLPLTQMHTEYRMWIYYGGHLSLKTRTHANRTFSFSYL